MGTWGTTSFPLSSSPRQEVPYNSAIVGLLSAPGGGQKGGMRPAGARDYPPRRVLPLSIPAQKATLIWEHPSSQLCLDKGFAELGIQQLLNLSNPTLHGSQRTLNELRHLSEGQSLNISQHPRQTV